MTDRQQPTVTLCHLSRRKAKESGSTYFSGYMGKVGVRLFKTKEMDKDGNEIWALVAQQLPPREDSNKR
jgi:hypothetical protein